MTNSLNFVDLEEVLCFAYFCAPMIGTNKSFHLVHPKCYCVQRRASYAMDMNQLVFRVLIKREFH